MTNNALMKTMIDRYETFAYTRNYIFGVRYNGNIVAIHADTKSLPYVLTLDRASRGQGSALRFKPTKEQKSILLSDNMGVFVVCSEKFFDDYADTTKYNKGEVFEKLVTEYYGQVWTKDNVSFTKAGDIEVNGVAYQIKFEKATFANEKLLAKLTANM